MKKYLTLILSIFLISCNSSNKNNNTLNGHTEIEGDASELIFATARTWKAYKEYAWGHDVLKPISKTYHDWYEKSLYISPIDAYSTLKVMGLEDYANEIEQYVIEEVDFKKDIYVKVFEVNIRILGGLLAMYELGGNEIILAKAKDFADRILPAFNTETGIPTYWVNLKTGETRGDTVNVAEAGTYTFEMGMLSYYTGDPKYYQAGKKATRAIFDRRSDIGLIGDIIDVNTGVWVSESSHICAGVDSYYEYLYKSYLMFGDPELGEIWDASIKPVNKYLAEKYDGKLWYGRANMYTGELNSSVITLYDAFFPALLAISGHMKRAKELQETWDWVWNKYGLEPTVYDYKSGSANYPVYDLNPEIIESAYYLYHYTGDQKYYDMALQYWDDINTYCKTDIAYTAVANVETMEKKDYMATYFIAETLKYFYLIFSYNSGEFDFDTIIFNTEAHPFYRDRIDKELASQYLGF